MADQRYCRNCGTPNLPDAKFCANCGSAFVSAAATPPLTAPSKYKSAQSSPAPAQRWLAPRQVVYGLAGLLVVLILIGTLAAAMSPSVPPASTAPTAMPSAQASLAATVAATPKPSTTVVPAKATATPNLTPTLTAGTTPTPTLTAATTPTPTLTPSSVTYTGPFSASKNSDVYHYPSCYHVKTIKEANLISFPTAAAAQAAGYRPCKDCNPPT